MAEPAQFDFIINRRAGTVLKAGEDRVVADLRVAFGARAGDFHLIEGGEIAATVRQWAAEHAGDGRSLVVGGGDGTILSAASEILGSDITLGVLPLGTQNFIARELGFSADYRQRRRNTRPAPRRSWMSARSTA